MAKEEEISKNLIKVLRDLSKKETEDKTFVSKITQKHLVSWILMQVAEKYLNPQAPVAQKVAYELVFRRFLGEGVEFFQIVPHWLTD